MIKRASQLTGESEAVVKIVGEAFFWEMFSALTQGQSVGLGDFGMFHVAGRQNSFKIRFQESIYFKALLNPKVYKIIEQRDKHGRVDIYSLQIKRENKNESSDGGDDVDAG